MGTGDLYDILWDSEADEVEAQIIQNASPVSSVEVTGQALKGIGKCSLDKYYREGNTFITQARWAVFFWSVCTCGAA